MDNGWIKLHRDMVNWEWYNDPVTKVVFLDLLIRANHEPKKWKGMVIERGQHVASYSILAERLGLSIKMVRTAIKHLKRTHEVAHKGHSKFGLFTINNYDKYQDMGTQVGTQRATNKNEKNIKNILMGEVDKKNLIKQVIEFYEFSFKTKLIALSPQRKTKIELRLKTFGIERVKEAIKNFSASPFHLGDNSSKWKADLDWIVKNDETIEKGIKLTPSKPSKAPLPPVWKPPV